MKLLLIAFIAFGSLMADAQTAFANDCSTNLLNLSDWSQMSAGVAACVNANGDFSTGISTLCLADKAQLSIQLQSYLTYQKDYQDALAALQAMPNPTAVAQNRVNQAKMDWDTLGNRSATSILINKVQNIYSVCGGN